MQRIPDIPINTINQSFEYNRYWINNKKDWIFCKADPPGENPLIYADCITEEHPPWYHGEHGTNSPGKYSHTKPWDLCVLKPILHHVRIAVSLLSDNTLLIYHSMTNGEMQHLDSEDIFKINGSDKMWRRNRSLMGMTTLLCYHYMITTVLYYHYMIITVCNTLIS